MSVLKLHLRGFIWIFFLLFLQFVYNYLGLANFLQCHSLSENVVSLLVKVGRPLVLENLGSNSNFETI